jgi:hypothetical protein
METCYKVMRTDILRGLQLESHDFRLEAEITAKVLRQGIAFTRFRSLILGAPMRKAKRCARVRVSMPFSHC